MSELDAAAEDSPLPSQVTPAMADALLRYRQGTGANALMRGAIKPFADIGHGLTTWGTIEQNETIGPAMQSALGLIGPPLGKGIGLAMGALAPKALPKLAGIAAESFRGALPKSLPADHVETMISAIKDVLGSDWNPTTNLPSSGSSWQKVLGASPAAVDNVVKSLQAGGHYKSDVIPNLADKDIDSALAANPGMSLFDLAGVKNPVEDVHLPIDTATLPRGATWSLPADKQQLASEQGYNALLHHGTRVPTIFDQFKLPSDEIGVHFGSPRAAQEIQGSTTDWSTAPRVYPAAIVAQNPLRMDDLGAWHPHEVSKELVEKGLPADEVNAAQWNGTGVLDPDKASRRSDLRWVQAEKRTENLRKYIESKGYDSIVYKNNVEDKGHDSYILFRESPTSPGHVYGARLPWADFAPSRFTSASIKAGIPLAGATAAYSAAHDGSLRQVQDVEHNPFPTEASQ